MGLTVTPIGQLRQYCITDSIIIRFRGACMPRVPRRTYTYAYAVDELQLQQLVARAGPIIMRVNLSEFGRTIDTNCKGLFVRSVACYPRSQARAWAGSTFARQLQQIRQPVFESMPAADDARPSAFLVHPLSCFLQSQPCRSRLQQLCLGFSQGIDERRIANRAVLQSGGRMHAVRAAFPVLRALPGPAGEGAAS